MSRNRRIVRMFSFDNRSYSLFEKKFVAGYQLSLIHILLALITALINVMSPPLTTALQATGNIKVFQIVICIIMLCDLPLDSSLINTEAVRVYTAGVRNR